MSFHACIGDCPRKPSFWLMLLVILAGTGMSQADVLWSDLGASQVHETGPGADILDGDLRRDDSSTNTLYFKFHVDPLSDASTEIYFAGFQLFEGDRERLAVGNALSAFAYSAFSLGQTGLSNNTAEYGIDLNSSQPEPSGIGTFHAYELVHSAIERTIVFKVQYVAGGDDLVTVWLDPDLRPGAAETNQLESLTTRFKANASFDQIHLRHGGGGDGWIFSEMAIATSFSDFVNANGSGAGGEVPFTFRSWQREQGLPENYVRALAQTRDGYVWVGSDDGVSRFDGMSFFPLGLQEGFQGGPVQVLFGDSRGALWVGSAGGGLSCWQGGKLRKFTASDGMPSESITTLAEDNSGRIWVGTQNGLVVWQDGHTVQISGAEIFSGKPITALFCDRKGTMWVGATKAGVFSYQGDRFDQLRDEALDGLLQYPHCLLVDQHGRIWIGAGDAFVLCRDGDQWQRFGIPRHLATHYIGALTEQPDGTVWAGSEGEGLLEFKAGKLVVVNASSGLSDNLVESLLVDREGKLWVGTHGGLNRISQKKVSVLSHNEGLDYGAVQGSMETQPGVIWVAQPNGVYQWDGRMFRRLALSRLPLPGPSAAVLLATQDGSCWAAGGHGLLHFKSPQTAEEDGGTAALTNLAISALGHDLKNGIWAGTHNGELWHFADGNWQRRTNSPSGHAITAIVPDVAGSLWVGTEGDGLYQLDGDAHLDGKKISGLPSSWIRTLYLDAQDILWIGTAGGGLSQLKDGSLATFTMREGLPDNTISQVLEDDVGNLWLGNNRGIARVKKSDLDDLVAHKIPAVYPQVYGRADGMLSEECSEGFSPAALKSRSGLLWFSTLKGILVIDPHHIVSSPAPVVILEQTLVDGVLTSPRPAGTNRSAYSNVGMNEPAVESLSLAPGKHIVEFHYTGLNFDAPDRVRFRYRLEGLDQDWVEAGTRRVAFYSSVPPGSYHFQVIACNGDGIWNETGASLALMVRRHFWQTWWFIAALILGMITVVAGSVRVVEKRRLQQQLKRLEQERVLERERTRIAQDLHDIMGAKLCRISFLSEHARRSEGVPAGLQDEIRSISDDSREVLQSLDEMVWAVNPEKDTLDHLVSYIGQYAQEYFRKTGIDCKLEFPAHIPVQPLSSQSRHHLFLAVHEALANILKHSGATEAKITMLCRPVDFTISISDNGAGFDPLAGESRSASSAAGFCNGLGNMRRRLDELGGRCLVESRIGHGTTVQFVLSFNGSE
ncbi:MAG TPA: two-component regulator propeller domain-containing protein [Candidatus Acidoferrales bacterium]|nr:two-component regulator propeller domain-containing protein [Candidatus Acidoferrales bacterium]